MKQYNTFNFRTFFISSLDSGMPFFVHCDSEASSLLSQLARDAQCFQISDCVITRFLILYPSPHFVPISPFGTILPILYPSPHPHSDFLRFRCLLTVLCNKMTARIIHRTYDFSVNVLGDLEIGNQCYECSCRTFDAKTNTMPESQRVSIAQDAIVRMAADTGKVMDSFGANK